MYANYLQRYCTLCNASGMAKNFLTRAASDDDGTEPEWDLADRMRKALRQSGLSVQEMAGYLGVSRTAVSSWINGRIEPGHQTLLLWALRTGVSFEWLTGALAGAAS